MTASTDPANVLDNLDRTEHLAMRRAGANQRAESRSTTSITKSSDLSAADALATARARPIALIEMNEAFQMCVQVPCHHAGYRDAVVVVEFDERIDVDIGVDQRR